MKVFQVVNGRNGSMIEEYVMYLGVDFQKAKQIKNDVLLSNDMHLTDKEKNFSYVEGRVYEISDDVVLIGEDSVCDAICDCSSYNLF